MIKWNVETRKLSELKAYDKNPRRITEKGLSDLIKSLELFGLAEPIVINRDDTTIGGHARVQALKRIKGKAAKVEVYVPDRLLDEKEVQELCVRLNKNVAGTFDFEMLGNEYDPRDLIAWGFSEDELGFGEPGPEEGASEHSEAEPEEDDARIIHCPKCSHEFSILTEKKTKKRKR
jgi:ParB-like nuclease family protein